MSIAWVVVSVYVCSVDIAPLETLKTEALKRFRPFKERKGKFR
jgi:hypothetical protein